MMAYTGLTAGILAIDREFRITSFSRRAQQITGFGEREVLGKRCFEVMCDRGSSDRCPVRSSLESGMEMDGLTVDFRTKGKGRPTIPLRLTSVPLRDDRGQVIGAVESFLPLRTASTYVRALTEKLPHFNVGHPQLQRILGMLPDVARSDAPVLLVGENGTGKGFLAEAIHRLSQRAGGPWVKVDCGAYRERVLEVEIFGCCRSMVHGIEEDRPGRIQLASGGTIFLQGIELLPSHLQVKLLSFVQEEEVEPLGGKQPVAVDTRLVSASHSDVKSLVDDGAFREDLFFRLNIFLVEIPPLRSMREAIPPIISQIVRRYNTLEGKAIEGLSAEALDILMRYPFPGNLRELDNIIHHAHVLCKASRIKREHLPDRIIRPKRTSLPPVTGENTKRMEDVEREVIQAALTRNRWNRKKTAQELGIDRTTLWRKMRRMGWGSKVRPT
jgi:PAS domain S-box-containing protein